MPPNRIDQTFNRLRSSREKGFLAYISGGDPDLARSVEIALSLQSAGVDILEIGIPFSDPLADGTVNQAAAARSLAAGATLAGVLASVREMRRRNLGIPIVFYTYLNPAYAYGFGQFLSDAASAGADGILVLDLPPDETGRNAELDCDRHGLKMIRLIAPNTSEDRVAKIAQAADGFIYLVSREGVTGERETAAVSIKERVAVIRAACDLPIAVGFGISTPALAKEAAEHVDAVIVGSAIVRRIGEWGHQPNLAERVADFVRPMVAAVKKDS